MAAATLQVCIGTLQVIEFSHMFLQMFHSKSHVNKLRVFLSFETLKGFKLEMDTGSVDLYLLCNAETLTGRISGSKCKLHLSMSVY